MPPAAADCRPELACRDPVERLPPTDDNDGGRDETVAPCSGVGAVSRGERGSVALESVR